MSIYYNIYLGPYLEYWTQMQSEIRKSCYHTFDSTFCPECGKKKNEYTHEKEVGRLDIPHIFKGEEPFADVVSDLKIVDGKKYVCLLPNHSRNPPRQMDFDKYDFDLVIEYASAATNIKQISIVGEIDWFREQFGKDIEIIDSHLKGQMSIIKWGLVLRTG